MGTKLIYVDENGVAHDANYTETKIVDSETSGVKTWSSQKIDAEIKSAATASKELNNATGTLGVSHGGTGATTAAAAKSNLGLENVDNVKFPIPVGFVYTQYPGELSPAELQFPGTWTDITKKFEGLFFRAGGDNAKNFDTCSYPKISQGTRSVTLPTGATGINAGDTVILVKDTDHTQDMKVTVSNVNQNTLNFSVDIPEDITSVLIAQSDAIQGHKHEVYAVSGAQNKAVTLASGGAGFGASSDGGQAFVQMGGITNLAGYGTARSAIETRPQNTSIRIWKRTA